MILGGRIELHRQVGSTNDLAKAAAHRGEPEGSVVLAEEQVQGRGRLGRTWAAPPGSSILCSVLLRPRFSPEQAFYLTIAASLAIYRAVSRYPTPGRPTKGTAAITPHPIQAAIKWPNDVLVNGRKVSGVLSESEFTGGDWAFAVLGFGINANLSPQALHELREIAPQATSLNAEVGVKLDRALLLANILTELEGLYLAIQSGQFGAVYSEWAAALETIGRRVSVRESNGLVSGQAVRVESDGALVLRLNGGVERRVLAGDVV